MHRDRIGKGIAHALRSLWRNIAYGLGMITLINAFSFFVSKRWLPLICVCLALILYTMVRMNMYSKRPTCMRGVYACCLTLIWSAIVMVCINLLYIYTDHLAAYAYTPVNPRIPYITSMVLSTVGLLVTGWIIIRGSKHHFCRDCVILFGSAPERGFVGKLYRQEGTYQLRTMFGLFAVIAISNYFYYYFFYININFNSPDRFFFIYVPTLLYVITLVFLGIRYICIWIYYNRTIVGGPIFNGSVTNVRFLVMCGDEIYISMPGEDAPVGHIGDDKVDTPVKLALQPRERVSDYDADQFFRSMTGITPQKVRFLYTSEVVESGYNTFHFACFVDTPEKMTQSRCRGRWVPLNVLQRMTDERRVAPMLISEINRIYKATMAWKSYDRKGYRLYNIKNYKPAFRLRDFPNWDIDYNDPTWLFVAEINEDRRFFRLRRLWRKYISGLSE